VKRHSRGLPRPAWLGKPLPAPDFLRPRRAPHPLSWALLAVALAAALDGAADAVQAWQQRSLASQHFLDARQRLERAGSPRTVTSARAARRPRDEASALLGHPWQQVFLSVETASVPEVRWLALEHGIDGLLRLEGESSDAAGALRVAQALQAVPGWSDVGLNRIERADAGSDVQRFDLKARRTDVLSRGAP
jgi:hypothetical protein